MTISSSAGLNAATAAAQNSSGGSIQTAVLGVALQLEAQSGAALVAAIPQIAPLATSGSVGTNINTYA